MTFGANKDALCLVKIVLQILYLIMGLFCNFPAFAENLLDVYVLAQQNDPTFESAKYSFEAVREKIPQNRSGLLPSVNLSGNNNTTSALTQFTGSQPINRDVRSWEWTVRLTQPLIRLENVYSLRESEAIVMAAYEKFTESEQDLILRVSRSYFDVLIAEESINVSDAQLAAAKEQIALVNHGYKDGTKSETDLFEAKASLGLALEKQIAAKSELEIKRAELEKIVGSVPDTLSTLRSKIVLPVPKPYDEMSWVVQARSHNPEVLGPIS